MFIKLLNTQLTHFTYQTLNRLPNILATTPVALAQPIIKAFSSSNDPNHDHHY
ncbi:MAG: hypothetical protein OCD76_20850 [Reichenbachiella sp.]